MPKKGRKGVEQRVKGNVKVKTRSRNSYIHLENLLIQTHNCKHFYCISTLYTCEVLRAVCGV